MIIIATNLGMTMPMSTAMSTAMAMIIPMLTSPARKRSR